VSSFSKTELGQYPRYLELILAWSITLKSKEGKEGKLVFILQVET